MQTKYGFQGSLTAQGPPRQDRGPTSLGLQEELA